MKKWMALLICCLLFLFVAGAMAEEPVTLNLNEGFVYQIYPDGYWKGSRDQGNFVPEEDFQSHTGPYVFTGTSIGLDNKGLDTCLDFYSIPHKAPQNTEPVTYTVTFRDACIYARRNECTAIRFGNGEGDGAKDITLNLINIGTSVVKPAYNHVVFSNQSINKNSVTVNIHNTSGSSLDLFGGWHVVQNQKLSGVAGTNVTVKFKDTTISHSDKVQGWKIEDPCGEIRSCSATPATCTSNGIKQHWTCDTCNMLFTDENGLQATTLSALTLPAQHALMKVEAKAPTCTADGNIEYYRCTRISCGKLFSDADGKTETKLSAVTLPAQHALTKVEAKAPTCTADGNIEYYRCTRISCGKLFSDADGKTETKLSAVTLPAQHALTLVPRKEPTYEQDGNIEYYRCIRDGCGKLFADAEGKQELTPAEVILPKLVRTDDLPQTGDSSSLLGWAALLGACCAGLWCLNRRRA